VSGGGTLTENERLASGGPGLTTVTHTGTAVSGATLTGLASCRRGKASVYWTPVPGCTAPASGMAIESESGDGDGGGDAVGAAWP